MTCHFVLCYTHALIDGPQAKEKSVVGAITTEVRKPPVLFLCLESEWMNELDNSRKGTLFGHGCPVFYSEQLRITEQKTTISEGKKNPELCE